MARRRRNRRGLGSIITTKRLFGLGRLDRPGTVMGSVVPVLVGAVMAAGTALGVRYFVQPSAGSLQANLFKHAPWVGLLAGGAGAFAFNMLAGKPAAFATAGGAAAGALSIFGYDMLSMRAAAGATPSTAGLGAIVPEFSGTRGLGAIVMENAKSRGYGMSGYGETVQLGNINASAFGTPGFHVT